LRLAHFLVYKWDMKLKGALKVLEVTAIVLVAPIVGQLIWPAHTKWGFMYSLGFSLIGGIALGILVERFPSKQKSSTVKSD